MTRPKTIFFFLKSVLTCRVLERGLESRFGTEKFSSRSEAGAAETQLPRWNDLIPRSEKHAESLLIFCIDYFNYCDYFDYFVYFVRALLIIELNKNQKITLFVMKPVLQKLIAKFIINLVLFWFSGCRLEDGSSDVETKMRSRRRRSQRSTLCGGRSRWTGSYT